MGLTQLNFEGKNKVEVAIEFLRAWEPSEGYYLGFSGGKDSIVIYDLAVKSGVKFDAHYNMSPIDPPEIKQFMKRNYPDVIWDNTAKDFWEKMMTHGPPMRYKRWCCELIKEAGGIGRVKLLGMRAKESVRRKDYCEIVHHTKYPDTTWCLPMVRWEGKEVWEYIKTRNLPYCSLYDEGFTRLGCVLCPFESPGITQRNLVRFPKIAERWRKAFFRYYQVRIERGTPLSWTTPEEFFEWWLGRI